nr:GNAT family N-acetyltransferase [Bacillus sp. FJAT-42315]
MLKTERCELCLIQRADAADVKRLYQNEEVRKYLGGVRGEESIGVIMDEMIHSEEEAFYWVVREKGTDDFIGLVSLDRHHDGEDLELSYQLLPSWWESGYATEVVCAVIQYGLCELKCGKVVAETQMANLASCRLLERVGMRLERRVRRFGAEQAIYGKESV